jgi:hypothetical protein
MESMPNRNIGTPGISLITVIDISVFGPCGENDTRQLNCPKIPIEFCEKQVRD